MNKRGVGLTAFLVTFICISLGIFFLLQFVNLFLTETNPTSEVLGGTYGLNSSINSINDTFSDFSSTVNNAKDSLAGSNPTATTYLYLIFLGAFEIPKAFLSLIASGVTTITSLLFVSSGGTGLSSILIIVFGIISAVILMKAIFLIIKAIRMGESEN